jgi:predicted membrane-bound spermidine synthase
LRVRAAFVLIFFLSGACALVYEVSWIRLFAVALGASAYSLCAVLAGFMAGLALGGAVAGRTADARRDALRLYAVLELAISVLGFLSPRSWIMGVTEAASVLAARLPRERLEELISGAQPVTDDQPHLDFALKGYDNYPALR